MPLRGGPATWEIFKKAFLHSLFPRENKEANVVEFINLHHRGISILEYSSKLTKLSKYAPSFVSNPRDKMSCFVTWVSDDLKEKCHLAMLNYNMNISCLMVHTQKLEETRSMIKSKDDQRAW